MTKTAAISGLNCPQCGGQITVPEGQRIVACPFCEQRSIVSGEHGQLRYQVARRTTREQAEQALQSFFGGLNRAGDLRAKAEVRELFVVYLPYWRARAQLAGWLFGRVLRGSGKNTRREPAEIRVATSVAWNDAACDVTEFGVQRVAIEDHNLQPYDPEALRADGMVFEPVESASEARDQARAAFAATARSAGKLVDRYYERFEFLREQLAIVFYPLWIARYAYRGRLYQVVLDGATPRVLYGRAPGNILYRAAMLVAGLAGGNCLLVNGTAIALAVMGNSSDNDSLALLCIPPVLGLVAIAAGYRLFRYGEEVEQRDPSTLVPKSEQGGKAGASPDFEQAVRLLSDGEAGGAVEAALKLLE